MLYRSSLRTFEILLLNKFNPSPEISGQCSPGQAFSILTALQLKESPKEKTNFLSLQNR